MKKAIIVGAGPAGLFAAHELAGKCEVILIDKGKSTLERRCPMSSEKSCKNCQPCNIMCGVGGSGTYSDGKLHYTPVLSHEKILDIYGPEEYEKLMEEVDEIFTKYGVDAEYYPKDMKKVQDLVEKCKKNSIHLFVRRIRHVGSDKLPKVIGSFEEALRKKGVKIKTGCYVEDLIIENGMLKGVVCSGEKIYGDYVILAPGRYNASWMQGIAKKYGLGYTYEKVEVGVRVEFPSEVMKEYSDEMYEAVFLLRTPTFDDVMRTFCPCPNGKVAMETYEGFVCVNGHSNSSHDSPNSNFAFVTEIQLTEPVENTILYAKSIAKLANTIGGGKPILQRLADLRSGRRSTWERIKKSYVRPSLKAVIPGDISMAFPHRVVTNIIEGLERLNRVMPGINSGNTLLYAPEIKLRSSKIKTDGHLETCLSGLYVAGDGAGVSGNIVGAAATGIIAARGILSGKD
ncbi:MAG: NAD(P)/FAD-dependent oxidoreductase [Candidatus Aenigmarchaeota archaeon]|nr:NAD(P)/FAD-dependent oxidoreductase [Candidatus Aenigmarchaeota archaeon]